MNCRANIITVVLILSMGLLLAGCGNNVDGITPTTSTTIFGGSGGGTDTTPPSILVTSPTNSATNVGVGTIISATFNETIDPASVVAGSSFVVTDAGVPVAGTVYVSGGTTAVFVPTSALSGGTLYRATVTTGVRDIAGNALMANYAWTFTTSTTADLTPPTVASVSPTGGATNVSVNTNISAVFSEALASGSVTASTFLLAAGGTPVAGAVSYAAGTATFNPALALVSNTSYTATLTTGIQDLVGNGLATAYVWSFTTAPAPSITTTSPLPDATETGAYSYTLAAINGVTPYVWSATGLPGGLTFNTSTGAIGGAPNTGTAGTYTINVTVTDADGLTANQSLSLTVIAGPVISTTSLPAGTETGAYSQTLAVGGGTAPYAWSTADPLPTGVALSTGGVLSGPIGAGTAGSYPITVTVTDNVGATDTQALTLIVNAVPAITTASLAVAQVGIAYNPPVTLAAAGGTTPYASWSATGLPTGLLFDTATGTISGTPGVGTDAGSPYNVDFTVTDANGVASAIATLSLTVTAAPVITTTTLPDGTETGAYSQTLAVSGGTAPYAWSTADPLPSGVTLSTGGVLSGPIGAGTAGSYPFTVTVTDNVGATDTQALTLIVNAVPTIITASLPDAQDLVPYVPVALSMTGGTGTMTWSVTPALPASMTFDTATGTIAGTPDSGANLLSPYTFDFTVTDSNGVTSAIQTLPLAVLP